MYLLSHAALLLGRRLLLGHAGGLCSRLGLGSSGGSLRSLGLDRGALHGRLGVDDGKDAGLGVARGRTSSFARHDEVCACFKGWRDLSACRIDDGKVQIAPAATGDTARCNIVRCARLAPRYAPASRERAA